VLLRTVTAIVLLAGFLAALFFLPPAVFAAGLALPIGIAALEWGMLCGLTRFGRALYAGGVLSLCGAGAAFVLHGWAGHPLWALYGVTTVFWCLGVPIWFARGVSARDRPGFSVAGVLVLVISALALLDLGPELALYVLGIAWIADTGAYLAGRAFGRRRLAQSISPGKTVEGALGGLGAVGVYAIICGMLESTLPDRLAGGSWPLFLSASLALGILSVVGDLYESALKRQASAKDSGTLLPGHGGVLDRIDSATAVLPGAAFLAKSVALGGWS